VYEGANRFSWEIKLSSLNAAQEPARCAEDLQHRMSSGSESAARAEGADARCHRAVSSNKTRSETDGRSLLNGLKACENSPTVS